MDSQGWFFGTIQAPAMKSDLKIVPAPPPDAHLGFSGGKKNIKFYFRTKRHTRKNSSVS